MLYVFDGNLFVIHFSYSATDYLSLSRVFHWKLKQLHYLTQSCIRSLRQMFSFLLQVIRLQNIVEHLSQQMVKTKRLRQPRFSLKLVLL